MATEPEKKKQQPPPPLGVYCKQLAGKNKLVLCHVSSSKQLKLQRELKSIMETYGFVCLSDPDDDANSAWVEYIFPAAGDDNTLPKPNLPANRIDGLHMYTYRAFLDAVNHYLQMDSISDLFIIQSIPVRRPPDARLTWRLAEVENESFVYRAQTLKREVFDYYEHHGGASGSSSMIHSTGIDGSTSSITDLREDSVVTDDQNKNESFVYQAQTLKKEVFDHYEHHGANGSRSSTMIHSTGIDGSTSSIPNLLEDSVVTDDQRM